VICPQIPTEKDRRRRESTFFDTVFLRPFF
jgi:hypothetical protein